MQNVIQMKANRSVVQLTKIKRNSIEMRKKNNVM